MEDSRRFMCLVMDIFYPNVSLFDVSYERMITYVVVIVIVLVVLVVVVVVVVIVLVVVLLYDYCAILALS
jgi:hypothetical protein